MKRNLARRIYSDLVKRRSRVYVVEADHNVESAVKAPVFIMGQYRSGTTLLRYCLDSHPQIAVPPETDFLIPLSAIERDPRSLRGMASMGFSESQVLEAQRRFAEFFYVTYAHARGKVRWGDKTPAYVEHIDWIRRLFPGVRMLHLFRNPLDQISSANKWGSSALSELSDGRFSESDSRVGWARWWAEVSTRQLSDIEKHPTSALAMTYEQLARHPRETLGRVASFIGEEYSESMLDFGRHDHDMGREDDKIRTISGFRYSTGSYQGWPREILDECQRITREPWQKAQSSCARSTSGWSTGVEPPIR